MEAAEGEESAGRKLSFRKDLGDLWWEAEEAGKREGGLEVDPKRNPSFEGKREPCFCGGLRGLCWRV